MANNKKQQLVKKCIELMEKAENAMECPVCFSNSKQMVQCVTGHHICRECQMKLTNCPICKNSFIGTKSFLLEDLLDALSHMKLSLSDLEEDVNKPIVDAKAETVRKLLKTVLFNFSDYCHKNNTFLLFLSKYSQNPNAYSSEFEKQLVSMTSDLRNLTRLINETESTLISLKK